MVGTAKENAVTYSVPAAWVIRYAVVKFLDEYSDQAQLLTRPASGKAAP
jgi:hypothetical protein